MVTVIVVFTRKGPNRILLDGGTSSWKLDPKRAGDCDYVVCTRNEDGGAGHGAAFLIGKVGEPVPTGANRYLITITAYALVNIPGVWRWRNPVRYMTMEELGIDPAQIQFEPMPAAVADGQPAAEAAVVPAEESQDPLAPEKAKAGLAAWFGVASSQIEIVVRV